MSAFWYTVLGIVFGGLISAAISYIFARKASKELRAEAYALRRETEDVRHYINALITYLEAAGATSVVRDEEGRPIETRISHLSEAVLGVSGLPATIKVDDPPEGEGNEAAPEGNEGG
jgi:gas vesicle protein